MASTEQHNERTSTGAPNRVFFAGWITAVVIVILATGGLVLAREFLISRQVTDLQHEAVAGPHVLVVAIAKPPTQRQISTPATVRGFDETDIYAKVAGYV